MTPKEKALQLIDKFENYSFIDIDKRISSFNSAKQCALVAVDEIINTDMLMNEDTYVMTPSYLQYWQQVKQEIETYGGE
jgi:hypothetical protein